MGWLPSTEHKNTVMVTLSLAPKEGYWQDEKEGEKSCPTGLVHSLLGLPTAVIYDPRQESELRPTDSLVPPTACHGVHEAGRNSVNTCTNYFDDEEAKRSIRHVWQK